MASVHRDFQYRLNIRKEITMHNVASFRPPLISVSLNIIASFNVKENARVSRGSVYWQDAAKFNSTPSENFQQGGFTFAVPFSKAGDERNDRET